MKEEKQMKEIPKNPGYNEGCSGNPIVCHFFARKFHAKTLEALMNYSNEFLSEGSWHSNNRTLLLTRSATLKGIEVFENNDSLPNSPNTSYDGVRGACHDTTLCLHVITCDTKAGRGGSNAWSHSLKRVSGVHKKLNVCAGKPWNGFRTKLESVLHYAQGVSHLKSVNDCCSGQDLILFADGVDVFFNTNSAKEIIEGWNIAREMKPLLFAAEMSCWVKEICTQLDMDRIYNSSLATSRAAFINTGVYIGFPTAIIDIFQYVLRNFYSEILKYDDQAGIALYFAEHPQNISIDRHWRVFGTLQLMKPVKDEGKSLPKYEYPGNRFSCLGYGTEHKYENIAKKCYQIKYRLNDIFSFLENTCTILLEEGSNHHHYFRHPSVCSHVALSNFPAKSLERGHSRIL
jgi:hypothetical protein